MKLIRFSRSLAFRIAPTIVCFIAIGSALAFGQTETILYSFTGALDGAVQAPLVFDKAGNLYGTTVNGGDYSACSEGCGSVFELSPEPVGGCPSGSNPGDGWCETVLYSFTGGSDGNLPSSGLVIDSKGNLYGECYNGGLGEGTAFELSPPATQGGSWTETTVYEFCSAGNSCSDGSSPSGGLVFDKKGNLYGTAAGGGGTYGYGLVFELVKPTGKGKPWKESVLYGFLGSLGGRSDGQNPEAGVVFDKVGNLYSTTAGGGDYSACNGGCGTVFELPYNGSTYGPESILYAFQGTTDGWRPLSGLVLDKAGNLYSTTNYGTASLGIGNVFELSPPTVQGGTWTESVLYNFQGFNVSPPDGSYPTSVIFDGKNLYGTTSAGGSGFCFVNVTNQGCGTVFKLTPPKTGTGAWTEKILWEFAGGAGGQDPQAGLILKKGAFYGTTSGGTFGSAISTAFELVP